MAAEGRLRAVVGAGASVHVDGARIDASRAIKARNSSAVMSGAPSSGAQRAHVSHAQIRAYENVTRRVKNHFHRECAALIRQTAGSPSAATASVMPHSSAKASKAA